MEEAGTIENGLNERPKSRDGGNFGHLGNASATARRQRAQLWPREAQGNGTSSRPHTLRHDGRTYRLEIRSRRGKGFWIMVNGGLVVHGETNSIALANVIKAIDPDVEMVKDERGRRLA